MEVDALVLELFKHRQGVGRRAEGAVELGGHHNVALADRGQQALALGPIGERDRAATPRSTKCSASVSPSSGSSP